MNRKPISYNALVGLLLVCALILGGCSKSNNSVSPQSSQASSSNSTESTSDSGSAQLKPVELSYYIVGGPTGDGLQRVQDAMNKILKEKINATIKINQFDWSAFDQKMNVMTAAGDPYDLVFTAPWTNNYYQNVAKGAFLPLDDLLDHYAPTLKSSVPPEIWDAARVNGKIYGAINLQIYAMTYGIVANKAIADKYNLDLNNIKKYEDLEPYIEQIKNGEHIKPVSQTEKFTDGSTYFGMDPVGDDTSVGWIHLNDASPKVINQYASPEYKQFVEMKRRWNQKGYFDDSNGDPNAAWKAGKTVLGIQWPLAPGSDIDQKVVWGIDNNIKPLTKPLVTTNRAISTMTAISKTSKNPERAMMFLELLNTDKELYNILCNGIEGIDYKFVDKNKGIIQKIADSGYSPGMDWMYGNIQNAYYTDPQQIETRKQIFKLNKSADLSPILGFNFNPDPVKTELAQTGTIIQKYTDAFEKGNADVDKILPEFIDKLNKAGADKIIAEKQKQVDEWLKSKK